MKEISNKHIVLVFLVLPLLLRLWGVGDIPDYRGDEAMHVPAAKNFVKTGHDFPDNWYQTPLKHSMLYAGMKIVGDNPYGWRIRNVIFGSLSILILYLLGREIFPDVRVAYLAGLFFAVDPLHVLFSRSTFEEVLAIFFMLGALYALLKYMKGSVAALFIAGISMGLSAASKWYYLPAIGVIVVYTLYAKLRDEGVSLSKAFLIVSAMVVLPLSVYSISFYAWFGRGYTLMEFVQRQLDAFSAHRTLTLSYFHEYLSASGSPWEWFVKPVVFGFRVFDDRLAGKFHIFMNDPPLLFLTLPALAFMAYRIYIGRDRYLFLVFAIFSVTYLQFLVVGRPIFIYSLLSLLPFAHLAVAFLLVSVLDSFKAGAWGFRALVAAVLLWGAYLYPLVSDRTVPVALYAPLLPFIKLFQPF